MFSFVKKVLFGAVMVLVLNMGVGVPVARAIDPSTSTYEGIVGTTDITTGASTGGQGIIFAGICPASGECKCRDSGDCELSDVLQLFVNAANFILGITGSAVLFVFMYGGFKWLLSRGDSHWVEEGKKAMTAGTIGLVIIFGSYAALNFIIDGLISYDHSTSMTPTTQNLETTIQNTGDQTKNIFTTQP